MICNTYQKTTLFDSVEADRLKEEGMYSNRMGCIVWLSTQNHSYGIDSWNNYSNWP